MLDEIRKLSQHLLAIKYEPYERALTHSPELKHRLSMIVGQRGIGKTTVLVQILLKHAKGDRLSDKILYVQADHFLMSKTSLYELAESFEAMGGQYLAIDEIHKYPDWSQALKSIYDTFPTLQILASGSSALEIYKGSHDLSRRAVVLKMQGMSLREHLELKIGLKLKNFTLIDLINNHQSISTDIIKRLGENNQKILPLFKQYLQHGYYPYFRELNNQTLFELTLEQNLHTTIESDLAAIYPSLTGNSIYKIKQLLIFIAGAVPFKPSWNKLAQLLEIGDVRTIKTYFKYLEDAGLIMSFYKASKKLARIESPEKVYLDNPNQYLAISDTAPNTGTIREIFFANMFKHGYDVTIPNMGDFLIDHEHTFEIGGKNKNFNQIKTLKNAYLVSDNIETGINNRIPLWLFGFLY